jgi:threonine/homoserine/homoserine lactone efflux protein
VHVTPDEEDDGDEFVLPGRVLLGIGIAGLAVVLGSTSLIHWLPDVRLVWELIRWVGFPLLGFAAYQAASQRRSRRQSRDE